MTLTSVRLAGTLQALIDSRLDTIERMLMGRVSRQDRLAIVKDVETQIFDILQESGPDEPNREDVLAALARLDPPEAYLPEDGDFDEARPAASRRPTAARAIADRTVRALDPKVGKISGILGISSLILSVIGPPMGWIVGTLIESEAVFLISCFGAFGLIFCGSLIGLVLAIAARFRGVWAILGGVLCPISFFYSMIGAIFVGKMIIG